MFQSIKYVQNTRILGESNKNTLERQQSMLMFYYCYSKCVCVIMQCLSVRSKQASSSSVTLIVVNLTSMNYKVLLALSCGGTLRAGFISK